MRSCLRNLATEIPYGLGFWASVANEGPLIGGFWGYLGAGVDC